MISNILSLILRNPDAIVLYLKKMTRKYKDINLLKLICNESCNF